MRIRIEPGQVATDEQVDHAFQQLSASEQSRFLDLCESTTKPADTKLRRIYFANAFGDTSTENWIYLDVSMANHACAPSAELRETDDGGVAMVAGCRIDKGEEICVCYNIIFNGMTAEQRARALEADWGFVCKCSVCTLDPEALLLSDARRQILRVLIALVMGFEFMDVSSRDTTSPDLPSSTVRPKTQDKPLSLQETCAYNIMYAYLCEAEGIARGSIPTALMHAISALRQQVVQNGGIAVINTAFFHEHWSRKLLEMQELIYGASAQVTNSLKQAVTQFEANSILGYAARYVSDRLPKSHALDP